ncbi:MAG: hypothetical protein KIT09_13495 [Bryobacteraceae bacterium]|nr:hypothetical protein [Bryobacteraceae bacterium]
MPANGLLRSAAARRALWFIAGLHGVLLLAMLPDYFADNDLGFHVSLGRQYGERGAYFWDHLNWAPTGRPNLQGPALHAAIGVLGRVLGGAGDSYVLAFSILAVLQWAAAMFTAIWFARRLSGDWAALFAAALLAGSVYAAGPFFVGVPSGWIFILTPWAVHFFLNERYVPAGCTTAAVMYVHLGGAPAAAFGVFLAAVFTRRWRGLLIAGAVAAALTSPYLVHFARHLDWYTGHRGHVAGSIAVLIYLLAGPGILWMLRRPRENLFPLVWAAAPLAWLFQDSLRFFLQSTIAAAVIAGVFVAAQLERFANRRLRAALAGGLVALATIYPLSIPTLPLEAAWAAGHRFPRELDWNEARALAEIVRRDHLSERIVFSYYDSLSGAMAVYEPRLRQQFGHWGEVRPKVDPAREISAGAKLYVLPLPPDDPTLNRFADAGWIRVHGGSALTSIATLPAPAPLEAVAAPLAEVISEEAAWLHDHAFNNRFPPLGEVFSPAAIARYRERRAVQRTHAGRIQSAVLIYAHALEPSRPDIALGVRGSVRGWGSVANFIGDETAMDYLSEERFERFRRNLAEFSEAVLALRTETLPTERLDKVSRKLFDDFFEQD